MNQSDTSHSIANKAYSATTRGQKGLRFAFVRAVWHADIVQQGQAGFVAECARLWPGAPPDIEVHAVPGALEIPLLAQSLARRGGVDAIVACALVVDGGIYRHDFVAHAVIDGLMRVQLDSGVPVFSVVLTPKDFHEHATHRDFFTQHFVTKGAEAARACQQTLAAHAALVG
ncbi:6,7-dimethyl-8-ribityllumazine synthase [Ottowia testudinis]|uniref:6,7-dimethyl-8-ribityllumazine synthase n=1 Tax=Ottowia testudinis TaxID=2816950 RepID=A0A975H3H7_9BURK|nr:6,7-dimethyl-8-ribityllumazine synthase [Ottowia testudinis]QTD45285.1 6,7-dimethyl-8-ribityllumazine synthase [Ottowia testudinis]